MISILHPSRQRPHKARKAHQEWTSNSTTKLEYILSLDSDDPTLETYKELFPDVKIIINKNRSLVDATNNAAKECTGDLIIVVSDDMECFPKWDLAILLAVMGKSNFLLKTHDGSQEWIATLHICDRAFYESVGYIYHPDGRHLFVDTEISHYADCTGRMIIRNDIRFNHNNPCYKQVAADEVNRRVMLTQREGLRFYLKRIKERFGLSKEVDIWKLSPEANGHKKYMNKHVRTIDYGNLARHKGHRRAV